MNKTIVVTGGTGGIGTAVIETLTNQDNKVYATYYAHHEQACQIEQQNPGCKMFECDITDESRITGVISNISKAEKSIDVLIHAVTSPLKLKLFESLSISEFREDIETIYMGTVLLLKQILPIMQKEKKGLIILMLSAAVEKFPKRMSSYIGAKAGLCGLMHALSTELDPFVKFIGISPSFVDTNLLNAFPAKLIELEREKQTIIQPLDIARLVDAIIKNEKQISNGTNLIFNNKQEIAVYTEHLGSI